MPKIPLRDLVIVLPGITGSVLQKNGKDIWNFSGQAFWDLVGTLGRNLQFLRLEQHDSLEDGEHSLQATSLIAGAHLIPGLVKIDGYADLLKMLLTHFEAKQGNIHENDKEANLFPFPYDWRLDNALSAMQLKAFVDRQLPLWRKQSFQQEARVTLIAHSMGGLVARYYLEVLEGWKDCRALITFGTPYRGSLEALGYLAHGYKKLFVDLTEVVRTFPSVYQLLPIYPVVKQGASFHRVSEIDTIPFVDQERAQQALSFHRTIEDAVTRHRRDATYLNEGYTIIPIVGTRQPTYQSALLEQQTLTLSYDMPHGLDPLLADGDGTVPRGSAIPIELSKQYYNTFFPEKHGSLQANDVMLDELLEWLRQIQVQDLDAMRGPQPSPLAGQRPAISLTVDDLYVKERETVMFRLKLINMPNFAGVVRAAIQLATDEHASQVVRTFQPAGDQWILTADDLPAGLYRITVSVEQGGTLAPLPVHDLFEIIAHTEEA